MDSTSNSRQVMWVAIGQLFTFAIGIVSPMILSRYLDKGDYGTYKQVMYVYNTLLLVFTMGLPRAYSYFIPRVSVPQSKDIIRKMSNIFLILGLCFSLLLLLGSNLFAKILNNPDLRLALMYFSPTPLLLLPVMGLEGILASYKKTQYLALYTVITRTITLICIVVPVVFFNGGYLEAIIGFDIASLLTYLIYLYYKNLPTRGVNMEKTQVAYKEILKYSLPLMSASIWIMIFHSVNQFFISRYYGTEVFADFSNGFTDFPLIPMVINSVATVITPLFSGMMLNSKEGVGSMWCSALLKSVKLIYPMAVYCIIFGTIIMVCFYGEQYDKSGIYFSIKNVECFFSVMPFYPILIAMGKTKQYSNIHMIFAILIIPLEYAIVKLGGLPFFIAIAYVMCSVSKIVMQFIVVIKELGLNLRDLLPFNLMVKILMISIVSSLLPSFFVKTFSSMNVFILLLASLAIYLICYYILCWFFRISYKDIAVGYIGNRIQLMKLIP